MKKLNKISTTKSVIEIIIIISFSAERAKIKEKRRQIHIDFIESHAEDYDPKIASCLNRFRPIMKVLLKNHHFTYLSEQRMHIRQIISHLGIRRLPS